MSVARDGEAPEDAPKDRQMSIPGFSPVCTFCRHNDDHPFRTCAAFPDGIPLEIWLGENKHTTSFPDDHGIQFELADDVPISVATKRDLPIPGVQDSEPS